MTGAPESGAPERGPGAAFYALGLRCWSWRSQWLFAKALAERFPTEADWKAIWEDELWVSIIDEVSTGCELIRHTRNSIGNTTDPRVLQVIEAQYAESLEAVHPLADLLGLEPEDVLSALIEGQ